MKMVTSLSRNLIAGVVIILITQYSGYGQSLFSVSEIAEANTAANVNYLTEEEKEVILYMNLARLDGEKFFKSFIPDFIVNHNKVFSNSISPAGTYVLSLKSDLKKIKGLSMMQVSQGLSASAKCHAQDMGKTGWTGHNSSDGTECFTRIARFSPQIAASGENSAYGDTAPLDIVCNLLVDNQVPFLGHRENILDPSQKAVGVGIAPHKAYNSNCVIDFSCGYLTAEKQETMSTFK